MLSLFKYFVYPEVEENVWLSVIVFFYDEGKTVVDESFIFNGNVNPNLYSFYTNFKNFILINEELHYRYPDYIKKIEPENVYLYVHIGRSGFSIPNDKLDYWGLFFSSFSDPLYKKLNLKNTRLVFPMKTNKKMKIEDIYNPLFSVREVYDKNSILFSFINL